VAGAGRRAGVPLITGSPRPAVVMPGYGYARSLCTLRVIACGKRGGLAIVTYLPFRRASETALQDGHQALRPAAPRPIAPSRPDHRNDVELSAHAA